MTLCKMAEIKIHHNNTEVVLPVWLTLFILGLIVSLAGYAFSLTLSNLHEADSRLDQRINEAVSKQVSDQTASTKQLAVLSRNVLALCLTVKAPCEKDTAATVLNTDISLVENTLKVASYPLPYPTEPH